MDYIALAGVNYFLKRGKRLRRLLITSALGSFLSLLLQILVTNLLQREIFLHLLVNTGMILLAFGRSGRRAFLENWVMTYLTVIFLGGIMTWESSVGIPAGFFWLKALIAAAILSVMTAYLLQKQAFMQQIWPVEIIHGDRHIKTNGYWDSGNLLVDPYINQPVNILSASLKKQFFDEESDYVRYVPYTSLGEKNGLLEVYSAEVMYIYGEPEPIEVRPAVFGIAEAGLLEGKEYDVILQASVMERKKKK